MFKRTHNCGDLRSSEIDNKVILNGWVNKVRLHGQVVFIDLRDRYGKTQIVFDADNYDGEFEEIIPYLSPKCHSEVLIYEAPEKIRHHLKTRKINEKI